MSAPPNQVDEKKPTSDQSADINLKVKGQDARKLVQPSLREGFSPIPNVKWDDVGGLDSLKKLFKRYIVQPTKNPIVQQELGIKSETRFLLYGPPGCGKTLIAKVLVHEAGANFIHIKGPDLGDEYIGKKELAVRTIFHRARTCSPCILFFDEVDALTHKEGGSMIEGVMKQLLVELDGVDECPGVYVIGATDRLEMLSEDILRSDRLGRVIYVPLPDANERTLILKSLVREKTIAADVDLDAIGRSESCMNFSGADIAQMVWEAIMFAWEDREEALEVDGVVPPIVIKSSYFEQALKKVSPSVLEEIVILALICMKAAIQIIN